MRRLAALLAVVALVVPLALTTAAESESPATTTAAQHDAMWQDFCERKPEHQRCRMTPSPTPEPTPSPPPTSPPPPAPPPSPAPTASPSPTATPTPTTTPPPPPNTDGILGDISALPTSGAAWNALLTRSNESASSPSVSDQDDPDNVTVLAKALVAARTGDSVKRSQVVTALVAVQSSSVDRALALGRELGAYVLAADLIGYRDSAFVSWVSRMRTVATSSGPSSLIDCHERRPNNWGTHCGASRVIADLYLRDTTDLARAITVWRGWLGDRAAYAGFSYGDLSWQFDSTKPVGINQEGAVKQGVNIDGVLPDDQRRAGGFTTNPPCENYVHEGLQGVTLTGAVLEIAGYPFFDWSDRAVVRAYAWLDSINCSATGDDTFAPFIVDHFAGTSFAGSPPSSPGKGFGFSDWLWP